MTVYRLTEFTSPTPEKVAAACEGISDIIAKAGAEKINVVMMDEGRGIVIAHYGSQAELETATQYNKEAFGALVKDGVIDGSSIVPRSGEKVFSA